MYELDELLKLATRLDSAAQVAEKQAADHLVHGETEAAEAQQDRATSGRHYSDVCRYFHSRLSEKVRRAKWTPPTLEEVQAYARAKFPNWPLSDVRGWHEHFQSNGWKVAGKTPMKDWKAAANRGAARYFEKHPEKNPTKETSDGMPVDPPGWRKFLKHLSRKYEPYWRAMPWIKDKYTQNRDKFED